MKVSKSIVLTISRAYGGGEETSIPLPPDITDWMVKDYDGIETPYIVRNGKFEEWQGREGFKPCGEQLR